MENEPVTYDLFNVTAPVNRQNREPGDPCHTLAKANAEHASVVSYGVDAFNHKEEEEVGTITANVGGTTAKGPKVRQTHTSVRRLTPTECERLQGFPDGYTAVPYKNKTAENCPDGPRYKALGNSWAVPCARWIMERIDAVDKRKTAEDLEGLL